MGIKSFSKVFKSLGSIKWADLRGKTIAIDAMTEIYRASLGTKSLTTLTDTNGKPTIHINVILSMIINLRENDVGQIWVFDFDRNRDTNEPFHNPAKLLELKKRADRRKKTQQAIDDLESDSSDSEYELVTSSELNKIEQEKNNKLEKLKKRVFVPDEQINDVKLILNLLGVRYVEAPSGYEGEHIASMLNRMGVVHGVYSGDTDVIPYGASHLYRKNIRDKKIYHYSQQDIFEQVKKELKHEVTLNTIIKLGVILGCDMAKKTPRVGPKTIFKKFSSIEYTEEQKHAIKEFEKTPNEQDIIISNEDNTRFSGIEVEQLLEWLVNEKGFSQDRIKKQLSRIIDFNNEPPTAISPADLIKRKKPARVKKQPVKKQPVKKTKKPRKKKVIVFD